MCQPNHTYYPLNNSCECFPQAPVFNTTSRQCQPPVCALGEKWNPYVVRCVPLSAPCAAWQVYNWTAAQCIDVCPVNISYIASNNSCNCTPQLPVFDLANRTCVAPPCWTGSQWNPYLLNCTPLAGNCSSWQLYNWTAGVCVTMCQPNISYVASNNSCNCTPQEPVFNYTDRYCQAPVCPITYLWDPYVLRCVQVNVNCTSWEAYDFKLAQCVAMCLVNQTYFPKYHNCSCPSELPFWNSTLKNCTIPACPNATKWNTYLLNCTPLAGNCSSWQIYNFTNASCVDVCLFN
jgi:hypothetical protein